MKRLSLLKFSLGLLLLSILAFSAKAAPKVKLGASAAWNLNFPVGWTSSDRNSALYSGFSVGGDVLIEWPKGWIFKSGIKAGFDHNRLNSSVKNDNQVTLDRWKLGVPAIAGYKFDVYRDFCIAPLTGLEFDYFFSTGTSWPLPGDRLSSAQLWNPCNLDWKIGAGIFMYDMVEVDILGSFGIFKANKHRNDLIYTTNYLPLQMSIALTIYF